MMSVWFAASFAAILRPTRVIPEYPCPALTPSAVVEATAHALQVDNGQVVWRFASPENKRATGLLQRRSYGVGACHLPWLKRPNYCDHPVFGPLVGSVRYEVTGSLQVGESGHRFLMRVWPRDSQCRSIRALEYVWHLSRQPHVRPACYEDDPLQAGVSAGPPGAGCWLFDSIYLNGGGDGSQGSGDDGGSGDGVRSPTERRQVLRKELAFARVGAL